MLYLSFKFVRKFKFCVSPLVKRYIESNLNSFKQRCGCYKAHELYSYLTLERNGNMYRVASQWNVFLSSCHVAFLMT